MPSGEVIIFPPVVNPVPVAHNNCSSGLQATSLQGLSGHCLSVQFIPSGEVITLSVTLELLATAINNPSSSTHVTSRHARSVATVREVHVVPSGEVITRLPVPVEATAAKSCS